MPTSAARSSSPDLDQASDSHPTTCPTPDLPPASRWLQPEPCPRPRRNQMTKRPIPTTRTTSWRAGSRDRSPHQSPVPAGAGACPGTSQPDALTDALTDAPRGLAFHVERAAETSPRQHHHSAPVSAPSARASRSAAGWSSRIWKPLRWGLAVASHPIARRDRLLEPGRHGALIGIRRRARSGWLRGPGDLALERADRPASLGRLAGEQRAGDDGRARSAAPCRAPS